MYEKIKTAYQVIGIICRNFKALNIESFMLIYKSLMRSHLEYANSVWNQYKKYLVQDLEKVQKRATKLVKGIRKLSYKESLMRLNWPTLKFRRLRGDMIEVYKILNGKYDAQIVPKLALSENVNTRGNSFKLKTDRPKYDLRKFSSAYRIVNLWNALSDSIVCADSTNSFKNKLDSHWKNEQMYFNYEAVMTGSGINIV